MCVCVYVRVCHLHACTHPLIHLSFFLRYHLVNDEAKRIDAAGSGYGFPVTARGGSSNSSYGNSSSSANKPPPNRRSSLNASGFDDEGGNAGGASTSSGASTPPLSTGGAYIDRALMHVADPDLLDYSSAANPLRLRDLRRLEAHSLTNGMGGNSTVLVRWHCVLVSLEPIRAIIMKNRVILMVRVCIYVSLSVSVSVSIALSH